eukprot:1114328-Prorocentrum_minimum.AAC.1
MVSKQYECELKKEAGWPTGRVGAHVLSTLLRLVPVMGIGARYGYTSTGVGPQNGLRPTVDFYE